MYNLNTPIWQLTVGEFLELAERSRVQIGKEEKSKQQLEKKLAYGIRGLAELLNCSISTAQKIKNSGVLDKAITQFGRKMIIDSDMALKLIKEKSRG